MKRREFLKSSMLASVAFGGGFVFLNDAIAADLPVKMYKKVMLSDASGKPIWFDTIAKDSPYIFCYPFNATPNFLLLLDAPVVPAKYQTNDGGSYNVPGGIGPDKTMVAYSAICPHQWSYPTREFSVINYYGKKEQGCVLGSQLIKCCAHQSVYDPKICAKKIDGPAENNLAMVVLEVDEKEKKIYAVGIAGKSQYAELFDMFKSELKQEYGTFAKAKAEVDTATVIRMDKYSANTIRC